MIAKVNAEIIVKWRNYFVVKSLTIKGMDCKLMAKTDAVSLLRSVSSIIYLEWELASKKWSQRWRNLKSYKTSILVLCAVNVVTKILIQYKLKDTQLTCSLLLFLRAWTVQISLNWQPYDRLEDYKDWRLIAPSISAIFGFTLHIAQTWEVLTPDIYGAH